MYVSQLMDRQSFLRCSLNMSHDKYLFRIKILENT